MEPEPELPAYHVPQGGEVPVPVPVPVPGGEKAPTVGGVSSSTRRSRSGGPPAMYCPANPQRAVLCGYMEKRGFVNTSWQRRWCRLQEDGLLSYWAMPDSVVQAEGASEIYASTRLREMSQIPGAERKGAVDMRRVSRVKLARWSLTALQREKAHEQSSGTITEEVGFGQRPWGDADSEWDVLILVTATREWRFRCCCQKDAVQWCIRLKQAAADFREQSSGMLPSDHRWSRMSEFLRNHPSQKGCLFQKGERVFCDRAGVRPLWLGFVSCLGRGGGCCCCGCCGCCCCCCLFAAAAVCCSPWFFLVTCAGACIRVYCRRLRRWPNLRCQSSLRCLR
jgi:hypothetical protein